MIKILITLIILIVPGGIPLLIAWFFIYPKHRRLIMDKLKEKSTLETIRGQREGSDENIVHEINRFTDELKRIDDTRIAAVDSAYDYVSRKWEDRAVAFGPAAIVVSFGLGAAATAVLWWSTTTMVLK